jgi:SAM-dependent methyltransferase
MSSSCWREVDAGDAGFFVSYLDRAAGALRDARGQLAAALELRLGCSVLDVGSGVGDFLIEQATAFPGIRAVGVDASAALTASARERAEAADADVVFVVGDAERLDFGDGSFDRVNCSRVLMHLEHPEAAVAEMARVLGPGGRGAFWEPDFDALMIDSDDLAVSRAVRDALTAGLRNPDIGRRLPRLLAGAGLEVVEVAGRAVPAPGLAHAQAQFHLFDHLDTAVRNGAVSAGKASAWREQIQKADAAGYAVVTPVAFRVIAAKRVRN